MTVLHLNAQSTPFINNREFTYPAGMFPPGPLGYPSSTPLGGLGITPCLMFVSNY